MITSIIFEEYDENQKKVHRKKSNSNCRLNFDCIQFVIQYDANETRIHFTAA